MEIKTIVIIGGGTMGCGIAQISLMGGYRVSLTDINEDVLQKAKKKIAGNLEKAEQKGYLLGKKSEMLLKNLKLSSSLDEVLNQADLIIEAVIENMNVKKEIFQKCGMNAPSNCILASNTSSMSIKELADMSGRKDQVCGIHFFNPPAIMPLVEIIKHENCSEKTINIAQRWANSLPCLKKERFCPVVLKDRPGFIANRITAPSIMYVLWGVDRAHQENISYELLDNDLYSSQSPMSPLILYDYSGLDIIYHTQQYYAEHLHPDFYKAKQIKELIDQDKLGAKSGEGFFKWTKGNRPTPDRTIKAGILNPQAIGAIQANESCRLLEEGVVKDWETIDKAILAGYGTAGPMKFLVEGNRKKWVDLLEQIAHESGLDYLKPCDLMKTGNYRNMRRF